MSFGGQCDRKPRHTGMISPQHQVTKDLNRLLEEFVPLGQRFWIWTQMRRFWDLYQHALKPLKAVTEHRTISFSKNVGPDFHLQIGSHAQDVRVEGGVMKLAQRQTVRHNWLSSRVTVGKNVGGIEKLAVF
jgi:hypothetical protein